MAASLFLNAEESKELQRDNYRIQKHIIKIKIFLIFGEVTKNSWH
jgi:hypothetical protein